MTLSQQEKETLIFQQKHLVYDDCQLSYRVNWKPSLLNVQPSLLLASCRAMDVSCSKHPSGVRKERRDSWMITNWLPSDISFYWSGIRDPAYPHWFVVNGYVWLIGELRALKGFVNKQIYAISCVTHLFPVLWDIHWLFPTTFASNYQGSRFHEDAKWPE